MGLGDIKLYKRPQQDSSSSSNDKSTTVLDDYEIDDDILDEIANSVNPASPGLSTKSPLSNYSVMMH